MNFNDLVHSLLNNTPGGSLGVPGSLATFLPELTLCVTIIAVLLARTVAPRWATCSFYIALAGLATAIGIDMFRFWLPGIMPTAAPIFTSVLQSDSFSLVMRDLLLTFAILFTTFTQIASVGKHQDEMTEFYVLMLGALVGMCLMISANHVLIVMLGVEMASVPCYVLASMQRNRPKASEAAMKYAVFGAGAAGIMLYGLSLLVGVLGSAHLPTMTTRLAMLLENGAGANQTMVLVLGGLMLTVGVAFKLSAVPFHFWAPDVFEGATAEVAAFLSVASKAAALGLLVRLATGFSFHVDPVAVEMLGSVRHFICTLLCVLAAVTCTFGNLAAYGQTNMKRLLAYSTIAHAGYMMMPVAAAVALVGTSPGLARDAIASLVMYIGIYLFMNLAAFAIVAFLRNAIHSEEIADYGGMFWTSPGLTVCMAIVMFSLVGVPPLAGFNAKWPVILAMISAAKVQPGFWALVFVAALNTVLSLFYYLRVVKVMVISPQPLHRAAPVIPLSSMVGSYCAMLTFPVVALFFQLGGLLNWANAAASGLFY